MCQPLQDNWFLTFTESAKNAQETIHANLKESSSTKCFQKVLKKTNWYIDSQSAAFGSYLRGLPAGASLRSATSPPPLASLAKPRLHDRRGPLKKRLDLQVKPRPRMASEVGSEVARSP